MPQMTDIAMNSSQPLCVMLTPLPINYAKPAWEIIHKSANPDRHFLMIDAKMMGHFVQDGLPHLLTYAVRIIMTVTLYWALVNGYDFGVWNSVVAIGSQWYAFIETQ